MKLSLILAVALLVSAPSLALAAEDAKPPKEEAKAPKEQLKSPLAKLSYSFGMEIGTALKGLRVEIESATLLRGVEDIINGKETLLTAAEATEVRQQFFAKLQEEQAKKSKELAEKNEKDSKVFLAENGKKEGVITTKSGLQYIVLKDAKGPSPKTTDRVKVDYCGTLIDGMEFDSSIKRGKPAVFSVAGLIPGWTEALQLMKVGGKYRLFIPSALGYGERGAGNRIGPNAALIFEVELLGIEKEQEEKEGKEG